MKLPEICIRQPVLAIVLSLVLTVLGCVGFQRLEIRFFPKLQLPQVNISTSFEGASAVLMENQITTLIENAIAGVDNIQSISSTSRSGSSSISVQFRLGGDLETEAAQIRDKVSGIQDKLPSDVSPPTISVGVSGSSVVGMSFVDKKMTLQDAREYLIRNVQPLFRQLPGVAGVSVNGSTDYAMRIWLNPAKMAARDVTVADIKSAIRANNIYFPAGAFRGKTRNYSIISDTRLKNAKEFSSIIVKNTSTGVVRLSDVSDVQLGLRGFYDIPMRIGDQKGLAIQVSPLGSANPISVANEVVKKFEQIKKNLPSGMQAELLYNNAVFLQSAINEAFISIVEAVVLVILVVILFLGSFRAASIPIVTIPISLIAVFFVIQLMGFSINVMSLLAMVLAIGLVVDDAIVMLENIHRHIESGLSPLQAAFVGSKEIAFPVLVMGLTLVAVYAPVGFVQGYTSELFKEFAFTLAAAVVISAFIALSLSPMMCSKLLRPKTEEGAFLAFVDRFFERLSMAYRSLLLVVIRARTLVVVACIAVAAFGYVLVQHIPSEFLPSEDYGQVDIGISAPPGSSLEYTELYAKKIMALLAKVPEIQQTMFQNRAGYIGISCYLKPWDQRSRTSQEVAKALNPILAQIPGVDAIAVVPDIVSYGESGRGLTLYFMTAKSYESLLGPINKMMSILKAYPGVQSPSTGLKFDSQQFAIQIKRDLAAELGVSLTDIADTVQAMMSGIHQTNVQSDGHNYEVWMQMRKQDLMSFDSLGRIYVPGTPLAGSDPSGEVVPSTTIVPLSSLISVTPQVGQSKLQHYNRMRAGSVTASIAPGYTVSQVVAYVQSQLPNVLKPEVNSAFSGKAQEYLDSAGSMAGILILSFIFIYLVLAAQFGSFIDPFVILLAVPLSMVGALFSLWLSAGTFSLYSQIGVVTLVGLISKHGILITKFINDLREQGVDLVEAITRGAAIRLRPVLMTTFAMVFGTLPLALASGPGSVGRHQIGWTLIGGLVFGTFFSLIVVPVAYSYLGRFKRFNRIEFDSKLR
mgnify:CR=1 FL=1